jgi:hypothetical protein
VHDLLVQYVGLGQLVLDRDELLARIPLVGKEEQARVEAAEAVRAVDEVVATPEQLGAGPQRSMRHRER